MDIDPADLPDNVEMLQRMVRTLAAEHAILTEAQTERLSRQKRPSMSQVTRCRRMAKIVSASLSRLR
jgi:hypothetical protein